MTKKLRRVVQAGMFASLLPGQNQRGGHNRHYGAALKADATRQGALVSAHDLAIEDFTILLSIVNPFPAGNAARPSLD
jgi:hypothetical protein